MKKRFFPFLLILAWITILPAQTPLLQDGQVVVTLGNSITEMGESPDGYVSILRKTMAVLHPDWKVYFVNSGIGGHKSTDMSDRFQRDVLQYYPAWVTISVGVNDVWHGFLSKQLNRPDLTPVPLDVYRSKVTGMIDQAKKQGIKVAIFTATVIKENLSSPENQALVPYNQALRAIARKQGCLLIDQDAAFRKVLDPRQKPGMADRGLLTTDGVHMMPEGNWLMARTALTAFGFRATQIDSARPRVEAEIFKEKEYLGRNAGRYAESNHELGPPCADEKRIDFYGSSSVDMWNLAADFPSAPFINRGIGGESTHDMWMRFYQDVQQLKPTHLILFTGSCNDFWPDKRMALAETKANLLRMARMAQDRGIKVALGAIMPVNDYLPGKDHVTSHPVDQTQALNRWLQTLASENGYAFVDFYSAVADSTGKLAREWSDDGMHCNAAGYARWKPLIENLLQDWGF